MLIFSLILLVPELTRNFYERLPHLIASTDALLYLVGPLIYFFTLFLTGRSNTLGMRGLLHFIPFVLGLLASLPILVLSGESKVSLMDQVLIEGLSPAFVIGWALECIHIAVYMILSLKLVNRYRKRIKDSYSDLEKINLHWLYIILIGNAIIWSLHTLLLLSYLFGLSQEAFQVLSRIFAYTAGLFVYLMGYKSLSTPEVFTQMKVHQSGHESIEGAKYHRSGLSPLKAEEYRGQLVSYMDDESPYLESELTLTQLAQALSIPNNHLSQVINEQFELNFFDFINSYRVREAKTWLSDLVKSRATMLEIAFESGFKSKSTFNAAFKKHTGQTPSEYKKEQLALQKTA